MAADDRLIEIMAELLAEAHKTNEELRALRTDVNDLKKEQAKTNLAIGELRLSVMTLAERIEGVADLDRRLRIVENIVLRQAS